MLATPLIASVTFAGLVHALPKPPSGWDAITTVYAFGDSYSFVGGTRGHANYSFIGDELDISFTPLELYTTKIIPQNTSSDGANWLEFLTNCYEGLPSLCINPLKKQKQLWDFAFAGSDIDENLLPLHHDYTTSLVRQVEQFTTYAAPFLPKLPPRNTLVAWWIGINDVSDAANNKTITDWPAFWNAEMVSLFGAVERVQKAINPGAHLFINVPVRPGGTALRDGLTLQYNAALVARANSLKSRGTTKVVQFDSAAWFKWALANAESLGFTNTTGNCHCDEPGYFWYDSGHPTELVHKYLAQAIDEQLQTEL